MVHGAVRSLFQLLEALLLVALVGLAFFAWRLSQGPVGLDVLTPYIEEALSDPKGAFSVTLDRTELAWEGWDRTLDIRARDVRAVGPDGGVLASVPEMSLMVSGRALVSGLIAPRSVTLFRPQLRLLRNVHGEIDFGLGEAEGGESNDVLQAMIDELLSTPDPGKHTGYLKSVDVIDADLLIEDEAQGTKWHAPDADISLKRDAGGLAGQIGASLDLAGEKTRLEVTARYANAGRRIDATAAIGQIRPAIFARLAPALAPLAAADLPLGGSVGVVYELDRGLRDLRLDIRGGPGRINAPAPLNSVIPVKSLTLRGQASGGLAHVELSEAALDLGGPTVAVTGHADGLGGPAKVKLDATVKAMPVDDLKFYWPPGLADNARSWVLGNLSKGIVREAHMALAGSSADGSFNDLKVEHLGGTITPEGVTVNYLRPMPAVTKASGLATFDHEKFSIAVKSGEVYGLKLSGGVITLGGLDKPDQFADIDLAIAGPLADALKLLDSKPLGYASKLGIQPGKVKGDAATQLKLSFPLLQNLSLDQLAVKAHADAKGVAIPSVFMDLDLNDGELSLDVDTKGMDVAGRIILGSIPADLRWRENFTKNAPFHSRYQLYATLNDDQRRQVRLDGPPFTPPYMTGPAGAEVVAVLSGGGRGDIDIKADLTRTRMELEGLGWDKPEGASGKAAATIRLVQNKLAEVPSFQVVAGDLLAQGAVAFDGGGAARRVDFKTLKFGRNDVSGSLGLRQGGGMDISLKGASLDVEPMLSREDKGGDKNDRNKRGDENPPPMAVDVAVQELWLSEEGKLDGARASLRRDGKDWSRLSLHGSVGEGKPFRLEVQPDGARRVVTASSQDAGAVCRAFGFYENMIGGDLKLDAVIEDDKAEQPITGTVHVSDYQVVKAPALARLLTVAALTGIVDVLRGDGISFSLLEAPFTLTDGVLEIRDGRAHGPALGITAKGQVDFDNSRFALEGTVVPAYMVNSVLGNIPLIGGLLTGEKGGGVFAVTYSMKGPIEDPSVTVNPLSALTPGFLRRLFDVFDTGTETQARPEPKDSQKR